MTWIPESTPVAKYSQTLSTGSLPACQDIWTASYRVKLKSVCVCVCFKKSVLLLNRSGHKVVLCSVMSQKSRPRPLCRAVVLSTLGSVSRAVSLWWRDGCDRSHHPLLTEAEWDGDWLSCFLSPGRGLNLLRNSVLFRLYCQKCLTHPFLNGHQGREGRSVSPLGGWPLRAPLGEGVWQKGLWVAMEELAMLLLSGWWLRPLFWRDPVALTRAAWDAANRPWFTLGQEVLFLGKGVRARGCQHPEGCRSSRAGSAPCSCPGCLWRRPGVVSQDWLWPGAGFSPSEAPGTSSEIGAVTGWLWPDGAHPAMAAARCRATWAALWLHPCSSQSASASGRSIQLTVTLLLPLWVRGIHPMALSRWASRAPLCEAFLTAAGLWATWTLTGCHPRQQSKDGRVPSGPLCPWRGAVCVGAGGPFSTSVTAYGALLFFLESRTSVHLFR